MSDEYRTKTGRVMSDEEIQLLSAEAERGYDVPLSAYPPCIDCGQPVDVTSPLALPEVVGFAPRRSQGGQNHVLYREETGRWLCPNCGNRRKSTKKAGTVPAQESLL